MDTEVETARKQTLLAETARALRVDLKMHENHQSHLEGIFSRGDRACADLLERAFRLGCRFDGWDDQLRVELWDQAIEEERQRAGFDPDRYLGTIPVTARLPWDHLDMQLEPDFLAKEYRKALKDRLSPPCGKPYKQLLHHTSVAAAEAGAQQKLVCYDCGIACDLGAMKKERLYYLRRMNAWTPPAPVQAPERRAEDAVGISRKSRQPTTRAVQGEPRRYRLRYTKLGRIAYLGHLDLIRHLPRIFRRAGLEIFYSVGFHPKPELSFGPALGLGIPSLGELLDVKLVEDVSPADLIRRLNEVSLDGVEFLGAAVLGQDDRALGRVVARSGFAARLPAAAQVDSALVDFAAGKPLSVVRAGKGGIGKRLDVRQSLVGVRGPDPETAALLRTKLGWESDRVIAFSLTVSHEGSARPAEVLEALVGAAAADRADLARVVLHGLGGEGETIDALDTSTLRAVPRKTTAAEPAA